MVLGAHDQCRTSPHLKDSGAVSLHQRDEVGEELEPQHSAHGPVATGADHARQCAALEAKVEAKICQASKLLAIRDNVTYARSPTR
jgi:hypothetical protein